MGVGGRAPPPPPPPPHPGAPREQVEGQVEIQKSVLDMAAWDKLGYEEDTQSSRKKYWLGLDLGDFER